MKQENTFKYLHEGLLRNEEIIIIGNIYNLVCNKRKSTYTNYIYTVTLTHKSTNTSISETYKSINKLVDILHIYNMLLDTIIKKNNLSEDVILELLCRNSLNTPKNVDTALRHNSGKLRFDWVPPEAEEALASILTASQGEGKKYPERNWEKGMSYMACYASMRRHMNKWVQGNDIDEESGQPHLHHALWNLAALVTYAKRKIGTDDRKQH